MKLRDWLAREDISFREFGDRIDRTAEAVRRYANDERIPERETMTRIFRATVGSVSANDFFDIGLSPSEGVDTGIVTAASCGKAAEVSASRVSA